MSANTAVPSLPACKVFKKKKVLLVFSCRDSEDGNICSHGHLLESLIIEFNAKEDSGLQDSEGLN